MPDDPTEQLLERLHGVVARERGLRAWLRSRRTPIRWALLALAAAALVGLVWLTTPRADLLVYPRGAFALQVGIYSALCAVAWWPVLAPSYAPAHGPVARYVILATVCIAPFAFGVGEPAHWDHPASTEGVAGDLLRRAGACLAFGAVLALPIAGLLWGVDRNDSTRPAQVMLLGAGSSVPALLALHVHCPLTAPVHLALGHAPLVLAAALAWWGASKLRRRWQRV